MLHWQSDKLGGFIMPKPAAQALLAALQDKGCIQTSESYLGKVRRSILRDEVLNMARAESRETPIREYIEETTVELGFEEQSYRPVLRAFVMAGFKAVEIDLLDILEFVWAEMPEYWQAMANAQAKTAIGDLQPLP